VDQVDRQQAVPVEQAGETLPDVRIGYPHEISSTGWRIGRCQNRQATDGPSGKAVIKESRDVDAFGQRSVVRFPPHAARSGDVEMHATIVPLPLPA
jgi:hypothetical protein